MSELSEKRLDEVVMHGWLQSSRQIYERLDQLALDCWMSLDYLQGYFMPEILIRIQIQWLDRQGKRSYVVLPLIVGDQFGTTTWITVILKTELVLE